MTLSRSLCSILLCVLPLTASADRNMPDGMNNQRIGELLANLDLDLSGGDGFWRLVIDGRTVMIITDENADRMRIIVPVTAAEALREDLLVRVMQANFDSALDARYAIAKDTLWSAYIHPLRSLDDEEFLLGLGQAFNLANTFGNNYASGLLIFGGGDSRGIREKELLDELVEKGLAI